jgi:hypothetical protein
LPIRKFLLADGLYAIPGVSLLFGLAYVFTDQFVDLVRKLDEVRPQIIMCVIAALAGYLIRYFQEHPVSTGDPEEVPVIGHTLAESMKQSEDDSTQPSRGMASSLLSPKSSEALSSSSCNGTTKEMPAPSVPPQQGTP